MKMIMVIIVLLTRLVDPLELHVGDKCSGNLIGRSIRTSSW